MPTPDANKVRSYSGDYMTEGRYGEEVTLAFLKDQPQVIGVEDFRELRVVHEADVDCAIKGQDGRVVLAEIKSDCHLGITGNVLFEILRINHTCISDRAGYLGWGFRSPATYFLYFSPILEKLYQCRANDLRKCVQDHTKRMRKKTILDWVNTDNIKSTLNILIPWSVCKGIFTVRDVSRFCVVVAQNDEGFASLREQFISRRGSMPQQMTLEEALYSKTPLAYGQGR